MDNMIIVDIEPWGHHIFVIRNTEATAVAYTGKNNEELVEFLNALGFEENIDRILVYGPEGYIDYFLDELSTSGVFNIIEVGEI